MVSWGRTPSRKTPSRKTHIRHRTPLFLNPRNQNNVSNNNRQVHRACVLEHLGGINQKINNLTRSIHNQKEMIRRYKIHLRSNEQTLAQLRKHRKNKLR